METVPLIYFPVRIFFLPSMHSLISSYPDRYTSSHILHLSFLGSHCRALDILTAFITFIDRGKLHPSILKVASGLNHGTAYSPLHEKWR